MLCNSRHPKNKRPSQDEMEAADYFFNKAYDVPLKKLVPIHKIPNKQHLGTQELKSYRYIQSSSFFSYLYRLIHQVHTGSFIKFIPVDIKFVELTLQTSLNYFLNLLSL